MARPRKKLRNKELVLRRLRNPKAWTFDALAAYYKINKRAAWEIFQRDKDLYREEPKSLTE